LEMQEWFLKMHHQIKEYDTRHWFDNEFMESVYTKFENGFNKSGTFCRDCEQKLFTINADGSIAGCPNAAPEEYYATLDDDPKTVIESQKRCGIIMSELQRDPRCFDCNMYKYCTGDCHQLEWEGNICPAPKLLMQELDREINGYTK